MQFESISVIIPTLNECINISNSISHLKPLDSPDNLEVIVVDGGSTDGTVEAAKDCGVRVLTTTRGRARQMNAGAESAKGEILLFLHADTSLPKDFGRHVRREVNEPGTIAGAFELIIDDQTRVFRLIELVVNFRSRILQMPYGDQAIFMKKDVCKNLGGFPAIPIMEDFEMIRRLKRLGRIAIVPAPVITSPRRWQSRGIFKTTMINQLIIVGYYFGVSPQQLLRWYR